MIEPTRADGRLRAIVCAALYAVAAFWLFSTDACGIYDNSNINLSSSGIGGPKPGQITFQFDKAFSLRGGSAWLLQVN